MPQPPQSTQSLAPLDPFTIILSIVLFAVVAYAIGYVVCRVALIAAKRIKSVEWHGTLKNAPGLRSILPVWTHDDSKALADARMRAKQDNEL